MHCARSVCYYVQLHLKNTVLLCMQIFCSIYGTFYEIVIVACMWIYIYNIKLTLLYLLNY